MTSIAVDRLDGLSSATAMKGPCRVATTANITLEGEQTIDGVAVVEGDRVLVKNQSTASQNGIYVADSGSWARAKDFSRNRDVVSGTQVYVTSGTTGFGQYYLTTANPITIGTTSITWAAGPYIPIGSDASDIAFTPAGGLAATTVQAALEELDSEKLLGALGSTDNRLLRADGTGGQTAQGSAVTVDDSGNVDGVGTLTTTGVVTITSNSGLVVNASAPAPVLQARRSDTPSVGRTIGYIDIEERDTAGTLTDATVRLAGESTSVTPGAVSGMFYVQTLQAGSAGQRMCVGGGVYHPSATGGDKGNNTINFGAVYDDNVLLSCYVFDAALDGAIDLAKWDALVPGERLHEDARRFAARLGTDTDPLDLDSYIAHWREKRHLTALPNEARFDAQQGMPTGAWIQRLIETVETQAVHIAQLHERLKAIEER